MGTNIHSQMPRILAVLALAVLLQGGGAATGEQLAIALAGCDDKCGNVSIPFPFGMGKDNCFRRGFEITCNTSFDPPRAFLAFRGNESTHQELAYYTYTSKSTRQENISLLPIELMDIALSEGEARAYGAVRFDCSVAADSHVVRLQVMKLQEPFILLAKTNVLVGVGGSVKTQMSGSLEKATTDPSDSPWIAAYKPSCYSNLETYLNFAKNGSCGGLGCCQAALPDDPPITTFGVGFKLGTNPTWNTNPCNYGMVVESAWYNFSTTDMAGGDQGLSGKFPRGVPLVLDFAIRDGACPVDGKQPPKGYACVSENSYCASPNSGKGYVCRCSEHYHGNPYITNGCQDINECEQPLKYRCSSNGICKNRLGGYDCPCRSGMKGDGKADTCVEKFPLAAKIAVGATAALSLVVVALLSAVISFQKRQLFRNNGGKKLQNVDSIMFFTKSELKKITRNYADLLGKGFFGKVYSGTLPDKDGTKVAVKTSVVIDKANVDEFTQEITIQSKMIHKNVLKLKGCCLEVKCPELVYEYAANGSLEEILYGKGNGQTLPHLPLEQRLDIAIGSAQGLAYMHTHTGNNVIQHGDVKPGNILLDAELVPKMADFGLSKLLDQGNQYAELVKGSKGYMDPVYHLTGRLTAASDVYSFGVVLLELISRKPIVYDGDISLIMEFQRVYEKENSGRKMFDQEIATLEDIPLLEGIGRLAIQCLAREVKDRPDMARVATRLAILKEEWKHGKGNQAEGGQLLVATN